MNDYVVDIVLEEIAGEKPIRFEIKTLGIAMWCARDLEPAAAIEDIKRSGWQLIPKKFPEFGKTSRYLLTTNDRIEVQGGKTCGEVEVVALVDKDDILIGIGSDHCDRAVEPYYYYKAKQMCPRVLGPRVWNYRDVEDHWDELQITAHMIVDGREVPFQKGTLAALLKPPELLSMSDFSRDGLVLYCGTPPMPDYIYGQGFSVELHDPVLNRSLRHSYSVNTLNAND